LVININQLRLPAGRQELKITNYELENISYLCKKNKKMTKQAIIERTIQVINLLPPEKAIEISDFADFIVKRYEEQLITENIQKIVTESNSFNFLNEDEELYSLKDLKEKYND